MTMQWYSAQWKVTLHLVLKKNMQGSIINQQVTAELAVVELLSMQANGY